MLLDFKFSFNSAQSIMVKAGKMVLLAALFLGSLKATPQLHAQTSVKASKVSLHAQTSEFPIILGSTFKSQPCSFLETYLVSGASSTCEVKISLQNSNSTLAQESQKEELITSISYATEPTYYAGTVSDVSPTPTPSLTGNSLPTTTPVPLVGAPLQQTPADLFPADGPNLNSDLILEMINAHRATVNKPPFQKDSALCSLAQTRSLELHGELFEGKGYLHSGLYNRNLPYWITENAKWGSNEAGTVKWWLNSSIHRRAIEGDYAYSCGSCNGTQCSQLFTSYSPKNTVSFSTSPTNSLAQSK